MTDTAELERLAASIPQGPWKWWTSNSYKRLMQDIGRDSKPVIEPYVCKDGCPDISISQSLMTAVALVPDLLAEVIALRDEVGRIQACRKFNIDMAMVYLKKCNDAEARANAAEADAERLAHAMKLAAHVLKVKQPDKLDDARSLLVTALAAHTRRVNAKEGV